MLRNKKHVINVFKQAIENIKISKKLKNKIECIFCENVKKFETSDRRCYMCLIQFCDKSCFDHKNFIYHKYYFRQNERDIQIIKNRIKEHKKMIKYIESVPGLFISSEQIQKFAKQTYLH